MNKRELQEKNLSRESIRSSWIHNLQSEMQRKCRMNVRDGEMRTKRRTKLDKNLLAFIGGRMVSQSNISCRRGIQGVRA